MLPNCKSQAKTKSENKKDKIWYEDLKKNYIYYDWFKSYGHVKWGIANGWIWPGDDASNIVHNPKMRLTTTLC